MIGLHPQLELLKRLGAAPVEPLVDVLRDLHQRGVSDSDALRQLLMPRASTVQPRAGGAADSFAAKTTLATATAAAAVAAAEAAANATNNVDYEAARKHFVEHGQRLREQAILAERLLDALSRRHAGEPPPLQHRLIVECGKRSTASVPFVVVNHLDREVDVSFVCGHVHGHGVRVDDVVSFEPAAPHLLPGAEATIVLRVDLRHHDLPADAMEFGVDVRGNDRLLVKLWVRIQAAGEEVRDAAIDGQ